MATQTQIRRDTATNINAATPAAGELAADLTNKRLRLGDGLTGGGITLPNYRDTIANPWNSGTTSGTNTYTMSLLIPLVGGYSSNQQFDVKIGTTNTSAATLNIDGNGAIGIKKRDTNGALIDVVSGDLRSGNIYQLMYDGTVFQILGGLSAASSNEVFISQQTASNSAQIDFTGLNSTYDYYRVDVRDYACPAGAHSIRLSNSGSFVATSSYDGNAISLTASASAGGTPTIVGYNASWPGGLATSRIYPTNFGTTKVAGRVYIFHKSSASPRRQIEWQLCVPRDVTGGSASIVNHGVGCLTNNLDIDGIRFLSDSGNISTGVFSLVGIKNA